MELIRFKMTEGCDDLVPAKAHDDDAGYDLKSRLQTVVEPGGTLLVPTGLFIEIPRGFEGQVRPRSGLALKHCITIPNSPGTVDSGYRGEVCVILHNHGQAPYYIKRGDRIAQLVIAKLPDVRLELAESLDDSHRGAGGFGSTGHN